MKAPEAAAVEAFAFMMRELLWDHLKLFTLTTRPSLSSPCPVLSVRQAPLDRIQVNRVEVMVVIPFQSITLDSEFVNIKWGGKGDDDDAAR